MIPPERSATILVVDDHDAARYSTVRTLRAAGYQTMEAATGGDALWVAEGAVDLVVLDINLPDIDGIQVCRELRARKRTAELPVIYLSATFTETADQILGMRAGADSYLTHPADPTALVATVRALLYANRAQESRRAANARFRMIFEGAPTGMAMLDADFRIVDANRTLSRLLGLDRADVVGRPLPELLEDQPASLADLRAALGGGVPWQGVLKARKGTPHSDLEWTVSPDPDGAQIIAMVTDVTRRRQQETSVQRTLASERAARAEAELSNELKDQFLATLSHELRNPLSAILGWARLIKRIPDLNATVMQGVVAIERNAQVQSHLISDLLDFAGIRFGKMRLEPETINPSQALAGAIETMRDQAQQKGIELSVTLDASRITVVGDPARLQQIFWNLLTNAIKFTPSGGRIMVSTATEGQSWVASIADSGAGVSREFLPKLFDRFSQQDSSKSKRYAGLGIGLSIVRHLVELHGGTVEAHSEGVGRGTTFKVKLPMGESGSGQYPVLEDVNLDGVRVLVVEDGDDARALIVRLLSDAGAEVAEAADAEAAIEQVRAATPDVLVSDIGMAGTDGYALLRTLRSRGYSADRLPAIALTAFVRSEDRQEAIDAGFQMHLGKPVNASSLVVSVARLARARRV